VVDVWPRPGYVLGGAAGDIALIALARQKLPDPLPISRRQHGMPDEGAGPAAIALIARDRADDPQWFADKAIAPFADLITTDLGIDAAAAALASEYAYVIEGRVDDPDDLGHVQAAWAIAKCVCEEGATVIIDVYAARAHLGTEVAALAADRAFDVMHEVTLFFDEQPDGMLAAWSLGLRKFGRPEIVLAGIDPAVATEAALLLRDVAGTLAAGERIEPGDQVTGPSGSRLTAQRFETTMSEVVAVDGDAILLR
jgi:hypothetical protein